jgi:hypothetical protein
MSIMYQPPQTRGGTVNEERSGNQNDLRAR